MSLVEFVRLRLDEDEAVALAIHAARRSWDWEPDEEIFVQGGRTKPTLDRDNITQDSEGLSRSVEAPEAPHIARHDPARVLRQVAALRAVVDLHAPNAKGDHCCSDPESPAYGEAMFYGEPCPTLRHLALIWQDHEDYDESWRP